MSKKRQKNISRHIKTRHKKSLINRTVVNKKVENPIRDINKFISEITDKQMQEKQKGIVSHEKKLQPESMNIHEFQQLLLKGQGKEKKQKIGKLSLDDSMYLEKLLSKYGQNYGRMAKDVKLNRMQWTERQIEKKHQSYKRMFAS